uniref:acetyl-CoA carboxylase carboxyltransferase beta subunit n=1 Tax=Rhododendron micranthum TaxID=118363 RepID=UPI00211E231B|nr:acetyl-CoA carboxylase carboxyltransferase beta subunit [Rhododendron micranthum]UTU96947.1 acetyl-CoA carboxylase carboxyltransferase beta subunit [Rhododendron micranthum]
MAPFLRFSILLGCKKRIKSRDTRISVNLDNWDNPEGWDAQEDPRWDDCGWHAGDDDDHESKNEKENDKESDNNPGGFHKYRHLWVQCDVCYGLNYKPLFNSKMYICECCEYHVEMNSSDRIDLLIDPDTWVPMDEDMISLAIEWDFEEKEEPFQLDLSEWEAELKKVYIELELRIQLKKEKEKADQERLDSEEEEKISSEEKDKTDQDRLDSEKQDLLYSEEDDQTYLDRLDLEEEEKISSEEKEKTDQDLLDSEKDEQTYLDRLDLEEEEKISSEEKEKTDQDRLDSEEDDQTYQERLNSNQSETGLPEAIQTGIGELNGLPLALGVLDFQFIAGTMGSAVGEKITRLIEYATREFLPLIIVCASGGARIHEGSFSLMQMGKIACALYNYQLDAKRFYISILASPTTGGVTASFGMLGKVVIAEPEATIAFAGKRVIEQTLNIEVPEGVQQTEFLFAQGAFDLILPRFYLKRILHLIYLLNNYTLFFV